jgi:hypothetical protein
MRRRAEEFGVRVFFLQRRLGGTVADDDLGAGEIERQKGLDILFDGDAADIQPDRRGPGVMRVFHRAEAFDIDAARPQAQMPETMPLQFALQALRRHHHRRGGGVEPGEPAPHERFRHEGKTRMDIFGKAGVEGGGEGDAMLDADPARRQAQTAFGGDMHRIGGEGFYLPRQGAAG